MLKENIFSIVSILYLLFATPLSSQVINFSKQNDIDLSLNDTEIEQLTLQRTNSFASEYVSLNNLLTLSKLEKFSIIIPQPNFYNLYDPATRYALWPLVESLPPLLSVKSLTLNAPFSFADPTGTDKPSLEAQQELADVFFERLAHFPSLKELSLENSSFFAQTNLNKIALLPQLEKLSIINSYRFLGNFSGLDSLKNLRQLKLIHNFMSTDAYESISNQFENLEELYLDTDSLLKFFPLMSGLAELPKLTHLNLEKIHFYKDADAFLGILQFKALKSLNLNNAFLSSQQFFSLFFENLVTLNLAGIRSGYAGIQSGMSLDSWDFSTVAPQLITLDISNYRSYDNILTLAKNTLLQELTLKNAQFSNDELEQLNWMEMASVEIIDFSFSRLLGLQFSQIFPNLKALYLNKSIIKPGDLKNIGNLKSLEILSLAGTNISRTALKHLSNLSTLHKLNLSQTAIRDVDFSLLSHLPLEELDLTSTPLMVSDLESLATLKTLKALKISNINNSNITSAHIEKLAAQLPLCQIIF